MQPENLGPLAAALAKAQAEFPPIIRDKEVDSRSYKFKYAPLDKIIEAVRPALSKNGLAITQLLDGQDLVTMLLHESGGFLMGSVPLSHEGTVQQFGSAITYLRRYALQALLGIAAEEDDDGDAAAKAPPRRVDRSTGEILPRQAAPQAPAVPQAGIDALHAQFTPVDAARAVWGPDELAGVDGMTTQELFAAAEEAGIPKARLTLSAKTMFGANRWEIKNLTDDERAALWAEVAPVTA